MDKRAAELIQKMAGIPKEMPPDTVEARHILAKMTKPEATAATTRLSKPGGGSKTSSLRSYIDDIIKGAQDNTYGRPMAIQTNTEWTHFDTAKTAGVLQYLGEQGCSVKEAAEYLGGTEAFVRGILAQVR